MTRHETLSLVLSAAALLISVVSPFANYYWFQNEVRVRQLKSEAFAAEGIEYDCRELGTILFEIQLKNKGVWPIANVQLAIQKVVGSFNPKKQGKLLTFVLDKRDINLDPPLPITTEEKSNNIVVRLKDALPPNSEVTIGSLQIRNVPSEVIDILPDVESMQPFVWVSSEVSSHEVYWGDKADCSTVERLRSVGH